LNLNRVKIGGREIIVHIPIKEQKW
ncbi:hypothetical protein EVA_20758, partial [gut metagenome]